MLGEGVEVGDDVYGGVGWRFGGLVGGVEGGDGVCVAGCGVDGDGRGRHGGGWMAGVLGQDEG